MQNAETGESLGDFLGAHRRAVIGESRSRQPPAQQGLQQAMSHVFGILRAIPLQMTEEPRPIIDHAEQHGLEPFGARRDHFE